MNLDPLPHLQPPTYPNTRLTIPARERLLEYGNHVRPDPDPGTQADLWSVRLVRPPQDLVVVTTIWQERDGNFPQSSLRLPHEPAYPREIEASCWDRGAWLPCPTCGYATLWCEAGFVPGHRICLAGHALQLAADGRSFVRKPSQDAATVRATRPL
jgi:hypothetical protein